MNYFQTNILIKYSIEHTIQAVRIGVELFSMMYDTFLQVNFCLRFLSIYNVSQGNECSFSHLWPLHWFCHYISGSGKVTSPELNSDSRDTPRLTNVLVHHHPHTDYKTAEMPPSHCEVYTLLFITSRYQALLLSWLSDGLFWPFCICLVLGFLFADGLMCPWHWHCFGSICLNFIKILKI